MFSSTTGRNSEILASKSDMAAFVTIQDDAVTSFGHYAGECFFEVAFFGTYAGHSSNS
jgi:hypothetical protein